MTSARESYLGARVEHAKIVGDCYENHSENPAVFVAGVQYALDTMLNELSRYYSSAATLEIEHIVALDVLNRAKKGQLR